MKNEGCNTQERRGEMKTRLLRAVASYCVWGILFLSVVLAEPSEDAERVRDTLIARAERISSLRLKCTLYLESVTSGLKRDLAYDFRFSDPNSYFFDDSAMDDNKRRLTTMAFLNGVFTVLESADALDRPRGVIVGFQERPLVPDSEFHPLHVLGYYREISLSERLSSGAVYLRERGGQQVLSHVDLDRGERMDLYLDSEYRITRMDKGVLPSREIMEQYLTRRDGDILDLYMVYRTLELSDYRSIGGIDFPLKAVRRTYSTAHGPALAIRDRLLKQLKAGEIDRLERRVQQFTKMPATLRTVWTVVIDPETLELNCVLTDDNFEVEFPRGTRVLDRILGTSFTVEGPAPDEEEGAQNAVVRRADSSIEGKVTESDGQPATGARVSCSGQATGYRSTTADKTGRYRLEELADEQLEVYFHYNSLDGYRGARHVTARAGERNLDIVLEEIVSSLSDEEREARRLVGKRAPELDVAQWVRGDPISLAPLRGRIVVLAFCEGTSEKHAHLVPSLTNLTDKYSESDVEIIVVLASDAPADVLRQFVFDQSVKYRVALDKPAERYRGATFEKYKVKIIPSLYVMDAEGNVRYQNIPLAAVEEAVRVLLGED
jgi:hypothetical protein